MAKAMLRSTNLKFERVQLQPQKPNIPAAEMAQTTLRSTNLKFERVQLQPQKPNIPAAEMAQTTPRSTDLKTEKTQLQPEMASFHAEELGQEHAPPERKSKARKRRPRYYTAVRRSARIRNTVRPPQNQDIEPVQITLSESDCESDKEEEPPQLEENVEEPAGGGEKTLVERVEQAVQLLEKMSGSQGNNRTSDSSEIRFRTLYIESQKKNEALIKENRELSLNLQVALAKIEGFEKGSNASVEWMGKFKEVLLVTSLAKASEMAAAVQTQDPKAACSSKRKRGRDEEKS